MRFWQSIPFFKILIPFIVGVFIGIYWQVEARYVLVLWLACFAVLYSIELYTRKKLLAFPYKKSGILIIVAFLSLGLFRADSYRDIKNPNHFSKVKGNQYKIQVLDIAEQKFSFYRFRAKVLLSKAQDKLINTSGNTLVYWDTAMSASPKMGEQYWVNTDFYLVPEPKNPNEFNYKEYLSYYNIYYKTYIKNPNSWIIAKNEVPVYSKTINALRSKVQQIFKIYLKKEEVFLMAQALILGDKNNLDEETKSHFAQTGTLHVLAVSGLHVGIIYLLLKVLSIFLLKIKYGQWLRIIVMLMGIWLYASVTGLSPSVVRASTMFTLLSIGQLFNGRNTAINSLFASAFIMLAINPFLIVNVGFQLSYAAVLGIMIIYQPIYQWLKFTFIKNQVIWFLVDRSWAVCSISIAAQLATFPISLFYFGQIPSYFMFSNLFIIPAIFCLVCLSLALLLSSGIPVIAKAIAFLIHHIASAVLSSVDFVSKLPFAYFSGLHLEFWQVILLYSIISFLVYWMYHRRIWSLNMTLVLTSLMLLTVNIKYCSQSSNPKIWIHSIKNASVLTIIKQNEVTIVADSNFITNKSARKFYLAPFFRKQYIRKIHTHMLTSKITGFYLRVDTIVPLVYNSRYPDLRLLGDSSKRMIWMLPNNSYTSSLAAKHKDAEIVWTKTKNTSEPFLHARYKLDSFAVNIAL